MSEEQLQRARQSDAPPTAAVHQHAIAEEAAEARSWHEAALVGRTITVNLPRSEVYAFWRDFRNFASFMENIARVEVGDDRRSHWVVEAPGGRTVEWDSVITQDEPDRLIAWESEGGDIRNSGLIQFADAPPGRGTYVSATILYDPPGGTIGQMIAKLFQKEPKVQARRDLRRFKQLMETGEISTSHAGPAAPRGGSKKQEDPHPERSDAETDEDR